MRLPVAVAAVVVEQRISAQHSVKIVTDLAAIEMSHKGKYLYSRYLEDQMKHYWRPVRRLCRVCLRT